MIEEWRLADSLGSFEDAIEAIAERWRSGERIPASGYFDREGEYLAPSLEPLMDDEQKGTKVGLIQVTELFTCTHDNPWVPDMKVHHVIHPDAREVGEQEDGWPCGDIVTKRCPNCGVTWKAELPQ